MAEPAGRRRAAPSLLDELREVAVPFGVQRWTRGATTALAGLKWGCLGIALAQIAGSGSNLGA